MATGRSRRRPPPPKPVEDLERTVAAVAVEAPRHLGLRGFFHHYLHQMARRPRRERVFLAATAFVLTALGIRALTLSIRLHLGPFGNVSVGGTHVHHLVWGILALLLVGFLWLDQFGTRNPASDWASRLTAMLYGFGAALTLDEFTLWLELKDTYWTREGRKNVIALMLFAAVLVVGFAGAPLFHAVTREYALFVRHVIRRRRGRRVREPGAPPQG